MDAFRGVEAQNKALQRVRRPVVPDSHHFDGDPYPHYSKKSDLMVIVIVMWIRNPAYNTFFINIFPLFCSKKNKIYYVTVTGIFLILKRSGPKKAILVRQRKIERKKSFLEGWTLSPEG